MTKGFHNLINCFAFNYNSDELQNCWRFLSGKWILNHRIQSPTTDYILCNILKGAIPRSPRRCNSVTSLVNEMNIQRAHGLPPALVTSLQRHCIRKRTMSSTGGAPRNRNQQTSPHPYSASLPEPGYEWCSRCGIRTHEFQKRIGEHHACLNLPRRIPLLRSGICGKAKNYWRNQIQGMILLSAAVFCFMPEDPDGEWKKPREGHESRAATLRVLL